MDIQNKKISEGEFQQSRQEVLNQLDACCRGDITAEELEKYLLCACPKPVAVYVTSPDYLGNIADISALSRVCHRHGVSECSG